MQHSLRVCVCMCLCDSQAGLLFMLICLNITYRKHHKLGSRHNQHSQWPKLTVSGALWVSEFATQPYKQHLIYIIQYLRFLIAAVISACSRSLDAHLRLIWSTVRCTSVWRCTLTKRISACSNMLARCILATSTANICTHKRTQFNYKPLITWCEYILRRPSLYKHN